jgi:hypothetical protein
MFPADVYPITWYAVVAVVVGVVSAARITRLLVNDEFPPVVWLRIRWDTITHDGSWAKLAHCPWCAAPYIGAIILAWALLSGLHWTWWVFNGWMAGSYAASWLVFHDEDGT